jgi:hypothetical protein
MTRMAKHSWVALVIVTAAAQLRVNVMGAGVSRLPLPIPRPDLHLGSGAGRPYLLTLSDSQCLTLAGSVNARGALVGVCDG